MKRLACRPWCQRILDKLPGIQKGKGGKSKKNTQMWVCVWGLILKQGLVFMKMGGFITSLNLAKLCSSHVHLCNFSQGQGSKYPSLLTASLRHFWLQGILHSLILKDRYSKCFFCVFARQVWVFSWAAGKELDLFIVPYGIHMRWNMHLSSCTLCKVSHDLVKHNH